MKRKIAMYTSPEQIRAIKIRSEVEHRIIKKAKETAAEKKKRIVPTIFNINYDKNKGKEYELTSDETDAVFKFITDNKIKRESFFCVNDNLWYYISDLNPSQLQIIIYVACHLTYNSNVFIVDEAQINKDLNLSVGRIQNIFSELSNMSNQIIIKTNAPKTYLVNHNVIFKGKLEDFIRDYNVMYDGELAMLDEKGRVIIK